MYSSKSYLFFKLFWLMALLIALPLVITGYRNYQLFSAELSTQIEERLSTRTEELTTYIDNWTDMNLRMMRQNASLNDQQFPL